MLKKLQRLLQRFFRKSRTLNHQVLNAPSICVLILVDIFILVNVFFGLNDISSWHLSPGQAYPCYAEWRDYRANEKPGKDYEFIRSAMRDRAFRKPTLINQRANYQDSTKGHLGQVSTACLDYADLEDAVRTSENVKTIEAIDTKLDEIATIEANSRKIRKQYDSTLLEKAAGQSRQKSINQVGADAAKQKLAANTVSINRLKQEITGLKQQVLARPEVVQFLGQVQNQSAFATIEAGYQHARFWYPSIQLLLQALFLVPLIVISYGIHRFALRKNYGLVALLSWHLLIISLIPTFFKIFEFLQVGALFQWVFETISTLFGGLLFLVSYVQIGLIPLAGFLLIKLIQRVSKSGGNPRAQAANRIMQSRCLRCAKKVRPEDAHCSHCGYRQYDECPSCQAMTHRHMPHCTHCGAETQFNPKLEQ
ncbi:zinc ribbon domain-containing protein [filamentous cyanobacterium LEGE 11480]|uniref:Zinc ribbon domain-containing protein n=1 Tax=Romeriopsis navalis LEGE 11480 TaxID=2777977 RepID=A0A928Z0G5_9CYAN|nr:zinc ribbon domain-containing protein [Romeriopsis navalis]MBE9028246.1 zinc ribbon domain-containing protein [Romeriopsis navalis LEGE 11480]